MNFASMISSRAVRLRALPAIALLVGLSLPVGWVAGDLPALAASLPTVTSVTPNQGPKAGGTEVTIAGTNFTGANKVEFGEGKPATSFTVVSATSIRATSPPMVKAGSVHVTVTTSEGGTSTKTTADLFTYVPAPAVTKVEPSEGPEAGGETVTITGTNLTGATAVKFASHEATGIVVNGAGTQLTATAPAGTGTVDVTVTTPGGTSSTSTADQFTYVPPAPAVTKVEPSKGPEAGGTTVTITGTNLTGATTVKFGPHEATGIAVNVAGTQLTATTPAGTGTVDVTVTTPGGTSSTSTADQFTYLAPTVVVVSPPSGSQPIVVVPQSPATTPKKGAVVCTLKVGGVHLPGKAKRHRNKAKAGAGTVTVLVNCDQSATVTVKGQLIEPIGKKPKHGKQRTRLVPFGSAVASVNASVQKALTLRLPKPAVIGLEHKKAQKVAFTIIANR
jgi:hypothetical protein